MMHHRLPHSTALARCVRARAAARPAAFSTAPPTDEAAKLAAARRMLGADEASNRARHQQMKVSVGVTCSFIATYCAYFYLWEQPRLPEKPPPPPPLPADVERKLPDGRLLMADGSIRAAAPR